MTENTQKYTAYGEFVATYTIEVEARSKEEAKEKAENIIDLNEWSKQCPDFYIYEVELEE